jgi:hypothetical protein
MKLNMPLCTKQIRYDERGRPVPGMSNDQVAEAQIDGIDIIKDRP